MQYLSFRIFI